MNSQEFATNVETNQMPWQQHWSGWSDSTKEQYFSMLNAEAANERELEMWRMNNEYNTPFKQMERLVAAGINPAAAFNQVSSGASSSVPGVHESKTASWHDTSDNLQRVNTIMSGIRDVMSTVATGIQAAQGVQSIALKHQNNWYDAARARLQGVPVYDQNAVNEFGTSLGFVELSPGQYALASDLALFPEVVKAYNLGNNQQIQWLTRQDQHSLVERRNRIDNLLQQIFRGFDSGASAHDMLKLFLQLFAYGLQNQIGGGY